MNRDELSQEALRFLGLEKDFFKLEIMKNKELLSERLDDDYLECGKSGRLFTKEDVIRDLGAMTEDRPIKIYNFSARELDEEYWLIRYITLSGEDQIFRASLWSVQGRMIYHQASKLTEPVELKEY